MDHLNYFSHTLHGLDSTKFPALNIVMALFFFTLSQNMLMHDRVFQGDNY